jgi:hypothetical protein
MPLPTPFDSPKAPILDAHFFPDFVHVQKTLSSLLSAEDEILKMKSPSAPSPSSVMLVEMNTTPSFPPTR